MNFIAPALLAWMLGAPAVATQSDHAATQDVQASDSRVSPTQPDFTIVALPTTLRMPRGKSAFRVTHRFARPLGAGDFGDLLDDFFGFDAGAQIGLEYRFGVLTGTQVGIHRTSDKTIEFFGEQEILRQATGGGAFGLSAIVAIEGINNFRDEYAPTLGAVLSREFGRSLAVYVEPMWIGNTNPIPSDQVDEGDEPHDDSDSTFLVGVGARWRVRPTVYLVAEISPRVAGFDPGVHQASIGIEKRVGGHAFQINFSNALGTTPAQIARGGFNNDNWYIGFNISRKFF